MRLRTGRLYNSVPGIASALSRWHVLSPRRCLPRRSTTKAGVVVPGVGTPQTVPDSLPPLKFRLTRRLLPVSFVELRLVTLLLI